MVNKNSIYIVITLVILSVITLSVFYFFHSNGPASLSSDLTAPTYIRGNTAVFLEPSDEQIEKMKNLYGEEEFYILADDTMHYRNLAAEFLESKDVELVYTKDMQMNFVKSNGERIIVDRRSIGREEWATFLFNGEDNPMEASLVDIESDYEKYFESYVKK